MRTYEVLQQLFATDHLIFITGLYRELLNRQPERVGLSCLSSDLEPGQS